MLVSQILKGKSDIGIITIAPDATIADAATLLSERRIGALMVSEDGRKALGILSERDIVRELGRSGEECLRRQVKELMTSKIVSCRGGDLTLDVLKQMTNGRFRHMPVVEEGQMIGFISIGDVVKARIEQLAAENDALEGMIKGY